MKEFNLEDIRSINVVLEKQIWTIFDILKKEPIVSKDYNIVLFLLSLYKDGIISTESFSKDETYQSIISNIHKTNEFIAQQYLLIAPVFEHVLKHLSSQGINSLIHIITNVDKKVISENFPFIFDSILYRVLQSQGRYGGEIIQPVEITRFICALADLPENSKVYNPFAGLASFGVYLDQGQYYFGQEISQNTWAIGTLRIMAYGRKEITRYECEDSILHWPKEREKFDLIVANPPYGMRLSKQYRNIEPDIRTVEQFMIEKGVNSLNAKGKLIILIPQGFLFRGAHEQQLRKYLIDEDLIDTIISLPGGLLLNTSIPLAILYINKDKKRQEKVRFIDANKFVESKNRHEKVLNDHKLNSIIQGNDQDSEIVRIIDNEQIREYNYNLNVPRYFQKKIEGVKLRDIIEFVRGQRSDLPEKGKFVRIRNLKDDKIDFKLDLSDVEEIEIRKHQSRLLNESCLLLATRWKTLKPTFFEFTGTPIFLNSDILSFKVNENIADIAYLIYELHADYVQEQLKAYRLGDMIPTIRRDDLLEVVIKLPSLEEQRAKVQGIVEISDKIKLLQKERNALVHGKATNQFNEFASLKHTLGRPRQNILDWTDNLLHFLSVKREGFDTLNKLFFEFYDTDIISALKEIKRDVNFMTEVLEKGENGFVIEEFNKTLIPLSEVNNIFNELSSNNFNFKIKKLLIKGEKLKDRGIYGNKVLLRALIDNLLTNAHKYGFEKKSEGNEVVFELKEVDDLLSLEVRNNGKPFPKNFDREKFITKYSTANSESGSGLGGYDIHRIASEFNNPDWELSLNEDPIYPVIFKFQFPIKLIN